MQKASQAYSTDKIIKYFSLHDDARKLIHKYSSGNGEESGYRGMGAGTGEDVIELSTIFDEVGVNRKWVRLDLKKRLLYEDDGLLENYGSSRKTKIKNKNINRIRKLLLEYVVSVKNFNRLIADGIESAKNLDGEVYTAKKLIEMGIPCFKTRKKLSGHEVAMYLNAIRQDWNNAHETIRVCHSNTARFLSWFKYNRKRRGATGNGGAKTGTYTKLNPGGEGRQTADMKPFLKRKKTLSIDQIWEQFHKTRDDCFRNLLMEHYRNIVRYRAERMHSSMPDKVELDDMISAGIFGLMDAIDSYDPGRGVKFETYCSPRIKGSILDEMRSMDWVPRLVRARAHQLAKATHSLKIHLERKPTEKEIAKELDMNAEEFNRLQRDANAASMISLDAGYDDDEKSICEMDIIEDPYSKNPVTEAQKRGLKNLLTTGLTRGERLIVILYYYEEMTMKEIGAVLDLSESRVSQMHSSIIDRLKAQMTRKRYIEEMPV